MTLDEGTDWFQPSNIEVTDLNVGNPAHNVIPGRAQARLSIRFNDRHRGADLAARIEAIAHRHAPGAIVTPLISGEAFLTQPGALSDAIRSEEHTSELQSLMRISYAVLCLKKKKQ